MKALKIDQLTVNYDRTTALWDISLEIPKGLIVGIIGPNGAGKSTLLKAILGLIQPIAGKIELFEKPLKEVRQQIAYVPQRGAVDWDFPLLLEDLVMMGRYGRLGLLKRPSKEDREAVDECLDRVGLTPFRKRQIGELSGGQQQRAFLARALMQEADIFFFDELFAGIDMASSAAVMEILRQLRKEGKTLFVVHHDLMTVSSYFDWIIALNMRLIGCGPIQEFFNAKIIHEAYGMHHTIFDELFL